MRLPLLANNKNKRIVPFSNGLLDSYPATMAYSMRKLRSAQTLCCQVRNASNALANIGFAYSGSYGGWFIDTAALFAHCGSGVGSIATWYDQSGNGRNLGNGTAANQPVICDGGVLKTSGGKPAPYFGLYQSVHVGYPGWSFPSSGVYGAAAFGVVNANDSTAHTWGSLFSATHDTSIWGNPAAGWWSWNAYTDGTTNRRLRQSGSKWGHMGGTGGPEFYYDSGANDLLLGHHQVKVEGIQIAGDYSNGYIDGTKYGSGSANNSGVFDVGNIRKFTLGGGSRNYADTGDSFEGYIGEMVFYNGGTGSSTAISAHQKSAWGTP